MATTSAALRRRAWVERARVGSLAERILEVDRLFVDFDGRGVLTPDEAEALRGLASRMGTVGP